MLFAPNLSLLWADLPLPGRFARAAAAGFTAAELWWPGAAAARALPGLARAHGLTLALLNFDGGDLAAGERGLAADPRRRDQLRANVPLALEIAAECGCRRLNFLIGLRDAAYSREEQMACARENAAWAAGQAAQAGCEIMIEAMNPFDNGPALITTTAAAAGFIGQVGAPNLRIQYDAYHMQQTEGNLTATIDAHFGLIGHVQVADVPGRAEPGTGEINYPFLLRHLEDKAYTGAVGLEYRPSGGRTEDSLRWLAAYRDGPAGSQASSQAGQHQQVPRAAPGGRASLGL